MPVAELMETPEHTVECKSTMITLHHLAWYTGNFGRSNFIISLNQNIITYWNLFSISKRILLKSW